MKIIKERYTKPISNSFIRGYSTYSEHPNIFADQLNYFPNIQYKRIELIHEFCETSYNKQFLQIQTQTNVDNFSYDKDQFHTNAIAYIYAINKHKNITSVGTGVVISPKFVLTSIHNVFNTKTKEFYEKIIIYFGLNGMCCQQLQVTKQNILVSNLYKKEKSYDYDQSMGIDMAIIYSDQYTLNQNCGCLPLYFDNEQLQDKESLLLYGYRYTQPIDQEEQTGQYNRCKFKSSIKKVNLKQKMNTFVILQGIKPERGFIGGPILKKIDDKLHIIGMYTRIIKNESNQLLGIGTIFNMNTKALLNNLITNQYYQPYQLVRNQKTPINFLKTMIKYDFRDLIEINLSNYYINSDHCFLTDQFANIICYSRFNQLLKVYLENNEFTDKAVQSLGKANWYRIQLISLLNNMIKNKATCKKKLKADFPRNHLTILI